MILNDFIFRGRYGNHAIIITAEEGGKYTTSAVDRTTESFFAVSSDARVVCTYESQEDAERGHLEVVRQWRT